MGPTRSVVKSEKDLYLRLESRISPIARSTRKMTAPMSMYTKITEGPAMEMARPEPMNRPVPMAPPIAMSWMWRLLRPYRMCRYWNKNR